jgi:Arc/MetJ-type ribon-helix-helix transcriptional regulator
MAESTKTIELPADFRQSAEEWVRAGHFRSVRDAAMAAFALLRDNEAKRDVLHSQVDEALAQYGRGELEEIDDDEFSDWLERQ